MVLAVHLLKISTITLLANYRASSVVFQVAHVSCKSRIKKDVARECLDSKKDPDTLEMDRKTQCKLNQGENPANDSG